MATDIESLVTEVCRTGCKVSHIEDPDAIEFVARVTAAKQAGKQPNLERVSEILEEKWDIVVSRRALSDHTRGKCSCQKKS